MKGPTCLQKIFMARYQFWSHVPAGWIPLILKREYNYSNNVIVFFDQADIKLALKACCCLQLQTFHLITVDFPFNLFAANPCENFLIAHVNPTSMSGEGSLWSSTWLCWLVKEDGRIVINELDISISSAAAPQASKDLHQELMLESS